MSAKELISEYVRCLAKARRAGREALLALGYKECNNLQNYYWRLPRGKRDLPIHFDKAIEQAWLDSQK